MTEKFRKIVKAPVEAFHTARKNITEMSPTSVGGKIAKGAGLTLFGLFQFLSWTVKYAALDNQLLRKFEKEFGAVTPGKNKKGNDKKFTAFLGRYPNLSSHILYYMLTASLIAGAKVALDQGTSDSNKDRVESVVNIENLQIKPAETYNDFLTQCQPATPYFISCLVVPEGVELAVYQDSRGIWTQGIGSTQTKNGPIGPNSPLMTTYTAYETSRWHAEDYETYFILYCYCCEFDKSMTFGEFLGLASFIYNGGAEMFEPSKSEDEKRVGKNIARENKKDNRIRNDRWWELRQLYRSQGTIRRDQVKFLFQKYPIKSKGSVFQAWLDGGASKEMGNKLTNYLRSGNHRAEGLVWRRWLEACLISGVIDPIDIMNCPVGGVYEFRRYIKAHGQDMIIADRMNYSIAKDFKIWIQSPLYWDQKFKKFMAPENVLLTKSLLPPEVVALCERGKCEVLPPEILRALDSTAIANKKTMTARSEQLVEVATKYLYDGDYKKAEANYKRAINADPNNALAYSDLSYLYMKWEKYEEGASVVRDMIDRKGSIRDISAMAGAYYNAGLCRRKMAEDGIDVQENYRLAKINMENAKELQPKVSIYQRQINEIMIAMKKRADKKKLSFNGASQKIDVVNSDQLYAFVQKSKDRI